MLDYDGYMGSPGTDTYSLSYTVVPSATSDNIPGVPLPPSPMVGTIDLTNEADDVFNVFLQQGDTIHFSMPQGPRLLSTGDYAYDLDMYLFGPGTVDVAADSWLAWSETGTYPEVIDYTATTTGYHYLDVYAPGDQQEVSYTITWSITPTPLAQDSFPGVPIPAGPFSDSLTWPSHPDDVFSIHLNAGDEATFVLPVPINGRDYDLMLYPPGTDDFSDAVVAYMDTGAYPEALQYTVATAGTYYLRVTDYQGYSSTVPGTDMYTVSYSVVPAASSNNVPGVALPASPVIGHVDTGDPDDLYRVFMRRGDRITFTLLEPPGGADFDLYLYGPETTNIFVDPWLVFQNTSDFPEVIDFTADETGYYFLDVNANGLYDASYTMAWTITPTPLTTVWRFYNVKNGTHFFTSSAAEADMVLATWPTIFHLDGVAYQNNPLTNSQPLYRFYNRVSASHFYTASAAEADHVIATWPHIFTYEGPSYNVSLAPSTPFDMPVYRFYNKRNGSHFYTASVVEADHVIATWPDVYHYDGIAYYLGQ